MSKPKDPPHPICQRALDWLDARRGKQPVAAFMREMGLKASDYHNLRRFVPAADKLLALLQAAGASPTEAMSVWTGDMSVNPPHEPEKPQAPALDYRTGGAGATYYAAREAIASLYRVANELQGATMQEEKRQRWLNLIRRAQQRFTPQQIMAQHSAMIEGREGSIEVIPREHFAALLAGDYVPANVGELDFAHTVLLPPDRMIGEPFEHWGRVWGDLTGRDFDAEYRAWEMEDFLPPPVPSPNPNPGADCGCGATGQE